MITIGIKFTCPPSLIDLIYREVSSVGRKTLDNSYLVFDTPISSS